MRAVPLDDDADDDASPFGTPLPPEDRLWRHPSELGWVAPSLVAPSRPRARSPRGDGASRVWGIAVVSAMLGASLTIGVVVAVGGLDTVRTREVVEPAPVTTRLLNTPTSVGAPGVVDIAQSVSPAITRIEVETGGGATSGSGVLFRDDGYLLTNAHMVEGATVVVVVLANGDELEGELIGADAMTDVAVVKIDGETFPVAVLGSATTLDVGEPAIAIGSPLGLAGGPSVTVGVVSALGRRVASASGEQLHDMIQTDAPIAPGSSGGALVDSSGVVIGITTEIAVTEVGAEGFGFATPIDLARSVADDIIETGSAHHVWLGIEGIDLDRATADELSVKGGARIHKVMDGSPAARAGLAEDDVIVAVEGEDVESMSALIVALRTHEPGERVLIDYVRDGHRGTMVLELSERPES